MTAVLNRDIGETTDPGFTRRRVWAAPDVRSHSLLVLTATRLYLTPPAGPPGPATLAAVESSYDLDPVLGPQATAIDLTSVRRVALDLLANTLTVEYAAGADAARVAVVFATAPSADDAFSKLWRRLGERFALTPPKGDPWALARAPVAAMAGLLVGTTTLALALSGLPDWANESSPVVHALRWADWRSVCGLGGAALALAQVWLYRRLVRPPSRLELLPR